MNRSVYAMALAASCCWVATARGQMSGAGAFQSGVGSFDQYGNSFSNRGSIGSSVGGQQGGMGQSGFGQGGAGQMGGQQGPGGQRGFVGNDAQDAQNMFQDLNGRQRRRAMFDFALESLNEMRDSRRRWQNRNRRPPPARVTLVPDIDVSPPTPTATATIVAARMTDVLTSRGVAAPSLEMQGRTAILRGTVATEHDKLLAAKLVEIEPGVSQVENRITVAEPETP